jgi:hypothetical protein
MVDLMKYGNQIFSVFHSFIFL